MAKFGLSRDTTASIKGISTLLGLFAGIKGADFVKNAADREALALDFEAETLEQFAPTRVGIAQRNAEDIRRAKRFVQSELQAKAAASGAQGPSVTDLDLQIEEQGERAALEALVVAQLEAAQLLDRAAVRRFEGEATRAAGRAGRRGVRTAALNTLLLNSGGTLAEKYGDSDNFLNLPERRVSEFIDPDFALLGTNM